MGNPTQHSAPHDHHGNSVAAWSAVSIMMIGSLVCCIAAVAKSIPLAVVGVVVIVVGGIAGKLLSAMGFGVSGRPGA